MLKELEHLRALLIKCGKLEHRIDYTNVKGILVRHSQDNRKPRGGDENFFQVYRQTWGYKTEPMSAHEAVTFQALRLEVFARWADFCARIDAIPHFRGAHIELDFKKGKGGQKASLSIGRVILANASSSGHVMKTVAKWFERIENICTRLGPQDRPDWWGLEGTSCALRAGSPQEALFLYHVLKNINDEKTLTSDLSNLYSPQVRKIETEEDVKKGAALLQAQIFS